MDFIIVEVLAGIYILELIDVNGCFVIDFISIGEFDSIVYELLFFLVSCVGLLDGGVEVNVFGGIGMLIYSWSDIGVGLEDRDDFSSGIYFLIIMDDNNCMVVDSFLVI